MADLILQPDVEKLVVDFLLEQSEVTDMLTGDDVFTELPGDKPDYMVRVSQFDDEPRYNRPLHLVRSSLQVEAWGGAKKTAQRLARTCRSAVAQRLVGVHDLAVVTRVETSGFRDEPDTTFPKARPRFLFVAQVYAHPLPASVGS